jgi:hypothetical protein
VNVNVVVAELPKVTPEMIANLRLCKCAGFHQIDANPPGTLALDGRATTCPFDPTFNKAFTTRSQRRGN